MECKVCRISIENTYAFCPFCGQATIQNNSIINTITTGNNSVNFGLGNNSKQDFYIDNFNVTKDNDELIVRYGDQLDGKVIGGLKGFKYKFEIAGVLSIVSALITIIDYLITKSNFTVLFVVSAFALFIYAIDSRNKYKGLKMNGIVYNSQKPILFDDNGDI